METYVIISWDLLVRRKKESSKKREIGIIICAKLKMEANAETDNS